MDLLQTPQGEKFYGDPSGHPDCTVLATNLPPQPSPYHEWNEGTSAWVENTTVRTESEEEGEFAQLDRRRFAKRIIRIAHTQMVNAMEAENVITTAKANALRNRLGL